MVRPDTWSDLRGYCAFGFGYRGWPSMTAQCRRNVHWQHAAGLGKGVKCNFVVISDDSLADVQESLESVLDG